MFAIAALALLVRLPGLFWGFNCFSVPSFLVFHDDELHLVDITKNILGDVDEVKMKIRSPRYIGTQKLVCNGILLFRQYAAQNKFPSMAVRSLDVALFVAKQINPAVMAKRAYYPLGYPYQVAGVASLLHRQNDVPCIVVIGRSLSILYAILTVILVFFLSFELFSNALLALLASLFLALSGLHVTQSHYATVDAGTTFWIYATIYFSLLSLRREKSIFFILALLSCGIALTFKLAWVSLIPLFFILRRQKRRGLSRLLTAICLVFFLMLTLGSFHCVYNFVFIFQNIFMKNIFFHGAGAHNKILNPFIYFFEAFTGMGLFIFLLFLWGCWQLFRQRGLFKNILNKNVFVVLFLPLLLSLVSICFIARAYCRHLLPLIPLLTIVAAFGFMEFAKTRTLGNSKAKASVLLLLIVIYQLVYVGSTEYYFIHDTREEAAKWVMENRKGSGSYVICWASCRSVFKTSIVNPFKKYPPEEIVGSVNPIQFEVTETLKGKFKYTFVKEFKVKTLTPELYFYKKFMGNYQLFINDTLIFKSNEHVSKNT